MDQEFKILITTHCFPQNPSDIPGNFIYDLSEALTSAGVKVTVLTQKMTGEHDEEYIRKCGAEVVRFDWKGGQNRFAGLGLSSPGKVIEALSLIFNGRKKFRELIKDNSYDLILNCWIVPSGLWSCGIRSDSINAVWALGSDVNVYAEKYFSRQILRRILKRTDLVFANSLELTNKLKSFFGTAASILFSGRILPVPKTSYKPEKKLKLAFVGRLESVKGPDILLSALQLSELNDIELTIIGDGSMRSELEVTVKAHGLSDRIVFTGAKGPSEISDILAASDYLVISSRSESMPVVFWEAMQTSTPVIATDTGDIKYYCDRYNVGRVCEISADSLARLISYAGTFRQMRQTLSSNTVKLAQKTLPSATAATLKELMQNH